MVRSDGTNDASVIDRRWTSEQEGYILPAACEPLFEATVLNRAPREALDGVGTFWELDRSAVSLFTYRFRDVASADREYQRLTAVLDNCRDVPVQVHARPASRGMLTVTPLVLDPKCATPNRLRLDNQRRHQAGRTCTLQQHNQLAVSLRAGRWCLSPANGPARHGLTHRSDACGPGSDSSLAHQA